MKKRVTLSIDSKTWSDFQKKCKEDFLVPSLEIDKHMKEKVEGWM